VVFLAPDALWDYLDPNPGGGVPMMVLLSSMATILLGFPIGMSRHEFRLI
jgi:hypothetical protein